MITLGTGVVCHRIDERNISGILRIKPTRKWPGTWLLVVLRCCTREGSVLSTLSNAPGMTQTKSQDQPPRPWDRFISDLDRKVYSECGFGAPVGLGQRPTLLIIDAQYRTTSELGP